MGNKKAGLKKLTKKYFWQQKVIEVELFIVILLILWFNLVPLFRLIDNSTGGNLICTSTSFGCNLLYLIIGLMLIFFLVGIIFVFCTLLWEVIKIWIKYNLKKAEQRAKEELTKRKHGK